MKICFIAYANMENDEGKRWRVNISRHESEQAAELAAVKFVSKYAGTPVKAINTGVHKFYSIPRREWNQMQYTSRSIADPTVHTWMTNEGAGCVLLFEGKHFEIV